VFICIKNKIILKSTRHLTFGKRIAAFRRLGFRKTPFGLSPSAVFCSSTFFCARKNASHFSLSGAKKRRLPFTLCEMAAKLVNNY
jgi:hypothetical protein